MKPKYAVKVKLVGKDGNAFAILGRVLAGLQKAKATEEDIKAFLVEATSSDYDHLLQTCMKWVEVV